ncbi:MAG: adenylosuccinate synthase, partial [Planctomycetota bacterium]
CQGGANAGHTVVVGGTKTILHLLPSGAPHPSARCIIGNGVVVDPMQIAEELGELQQQGVDLRPRLMVSDRAHLVMPWHKALDAAAEQARGANKVGTTLRGIGPCYSDKVNRIGLRCGLLRRPSVFRERLRRLLEQADRQLSLVGDERIDIDAVMAESLPACERIAPFVADTVDLLQRQDAENTILFEGAQGSMLDIDFGTYPFVTSSNTGIGGVITGSGLSHHELGEVIGIVKAYTTRVGAGPFPCELDDATGEQLRKRGGEFGATTGRPRRCGWLDLNIVAYACRINGVDTIALTKLDVLSGRESIEVCTAYELDGQRLDTIPADATDLEAVRPVYQTLPGWQEDITGCRSYDELPAAARSYIDFIERHTGVHVGCIGVGPGRDEVILR